MAEKHPDLFGGRTPIIEPAGGPAGKWKKQMKYRNTDSREFRCGTCRHLVQGHYEKACYKCALLGDSSSQSSDVHLSGVCAKWDRNAQAGSR